MALLLLFAFISGIFTIFAPCIWPILPVVLSSSATGGHRKAVGITLGVVLSFAFFTLSVSYLVMLFNFDPNILRLIAALAIAFLGLTLIFPALLIRYELLMSKVANFIGGQSLAQHHGFIGGFITGLSLGVIWSPCAGPILATIATLAATQSVNLEIILVTAAFSLGVGVPLLLFSLAGSFLFQKSRFISKYMQHLQKVFGVIMILAALAIYTNYDKVIQTKLLDFFPSITNFVSNIENNSRVTEQLKILKGDKNSTPQIKMKKTSDLSVLGVAPEFVGISNWLNSSPLNMQDLRGKVVLVDFWTYTCINCIRTLPYVTSWYEKYKDLSFVVIGVHTPEFEFEKSAQNVQNAIKQYNITYPVAQDNSYSTWNAYSNQYWPAKYLIDTKGNVRYYHFGEGKYEETEKAIQALLEEAGSGVSDEKVDRVEQTPRAVTSPETYLGSKRMQLLHPEGKVGNITKKFELVKSLPESKFSLGGEWTISDEYAMSGKNAVLEYHFKASKVFLVIRPGSTPIPEGKTIRVMLDGKAVSNEFSGSDVKDGTIRLDVDRLYNLIDLKGKVENHILRLEGIDPGTSFFAFTFG